MMATLVRVVEGTTKPFRRQAMIGFLFLEMLSANTLRDLVTWVVGEPESVPCTCVT